MLVSMLSEQSFQNPEALRIVLNYCCFNEDVPPL
jgi:hypothetical protein